MLQKLSIGCVLFLILLKQSEGSGCAPVNTLHMTVTCESKWGSRKGWVSCEESVPVGTVARYECQMYYIPDNPRDQNNSVSECQENGLWSRPIPRCIPECGRTTEEAIPLVVNGSGVKYGEWPWQAALYNLQGGIWTFWCGGTLVNEYAVITAAHCIWNQKAENFKIAVGKFKRDFDKKEEMTQILQVKEIITHPIYQDREGNYGSDIAVLLLTSLVNFSPVVRPVCIDWNLTFMDTDLAEGKLGTVAGWGITENESFSDSLRIIQMPVISYEHCIKEQPKDFRKYITYTSICAGYQNGSGVCNGDSGGGLIFPHNTGWMLHGIVSVSPRRRGTSFCDPTKFTVFTKVGIYSRWLKSVLEAIDPNRGMVQKEEADDVIL